MNASIPFQFSMLRYVHDTFTGEFLNAGLALFSPVVPYFQVRLLTRYRRVTNAFPGADGEHYRRYVSALQTKFDRLAQKVNSQQMEFGAPARTRLEDLLASVLAVDDSSVRFGTSSGGMSLDLDATFDDLYSRLVEAHLPSERPDAHDEDRIWRLFSSSLKEYRITHQLGRVIIRTPRDDIEFDHAWKNSKWNALQPVSFNLIHPSSIRRKSHEWFAANVMIAEAPDVAKIYYLLGLPQRDDSALLRAYTKAKDVLGTGAFAKKVELIEEGEAYDFARSIAPKIIQDTAH